MTTMDTKRVAQFLIHGTSRVYQVATVIFFFFLFLAAPHPPLRHSRCRGREGGILGRLLRTTAGIFLLFFLGPI